MNTRRITAGIGALVAASLALSSSAYAATTARYAGDDRYETAAKVSNITFGDPVEVVYVATGESFADALAGGAAAAEVDGPILLVSADGVPDATAAELSRLAPAEVRVLGGTGVISDPVLAEIEEITSAEVTRIAGNNRYTTAVEVSRTAFEPGVLSVFIVGGAGFADALAAGAAAASQRGPVLLVEQNSLPDTVAAELDRLAPGRITIVGGTGAVSAAVATELATHTDGQVTRLAGADRYSTAAAVSSATFNTPSTRVFLASGLGFADALAGTAAAAASNAPLLLTRPNCVPQVVQDEIDRLAPDEIVLLGGTGTLGAGAEGGDVCEDLDL